MEFKKVYVEVTNVCNLNCKFCIGHHREPRFITMEEFRIVLNKLQGFTKYLYFHVMGEPLLHPQINELINEASETYFINITTNGYLIERIKDNKNIRQVNISLHSFNEKEGVSLEEYMDKVLEVGNSLAEGGTYISYRMWARNPNKEKIVDKINQYFKTRISGDLSEKIKDSIFFEVEQEFIWPSLSNEFSAQIGTCRGLIDHIGILVSGRVVPCCLDSAGTIDLGNIYKQELGDIISSDIYQKLRQGFLDNKKIHELCKKCNFYEMKR